MRRSWSLHPLLSLGQMLFEHPTWLQIAYPYFLQMRSSCGLASQFDFSPFLFSYFVILAMYRVGPQDSTQEREIIQATAKQPGWLVFSFSQFPVSNTPVSILKNIPVATDTYEINEGRDEFHQPLQKGQPKFIHIRK